ncbi:sensor histidine kinase [Epidermidibacterium keratini]|nr:histidine kinase [Epidermidibacterium keratini]
MPQRPQPAWLTACLALVATVLAAAGLVSSAAGAGDVAVGWVGWVLAPVLGLVLWARGQRWPVSTLVVSVVLLDAYYVSQRPPIGFALLLVPALVNAAERGQVRRSIVVAALALLSCYLCRVVLLDQEIRILGNQLLAEIALVVGALALGDAMHARGRWHAETERRVDLELAAHAGRVRARVDAERRRLSGDIHDVMGHTLVVVSQRANVALATLAADQDRPREALQVIKDTARAARREVDDAVAVLRSPTDLADNATRPRSPVPRLADLEALAETARAGGITVDLSMLGTEVGAGALVESTAYRIVQEALTNVQRHSFATHVEITIIRADDRLQLRVRDNGGATEHWIAGSGIAGMHERVALVGGRVDITAHDGGFCVTAVVPVRVQ